MNIGEDHILDDSELDELYSYPADPEEEETNDPENRIVESINKVW